MAFIARIKEARAARHEPEARRAMLRTYWSSLIIFLAVVIVASLGYGTWEFARPLVAEEGGATLGTPRPPLDRAELRGVLEGFDARLERFETRRAEPSLVADPS